MNKKIAYLFPGQGAQYPGMGKDFYDHFSVSRAVFEEADDLLSEKFSRLIFEGDMKELTLTKNSQLAIFITSVAILRCLETQFSQLKPQLAAGLSLGEYTALVAASKLSFSKCLHLVKARAQFMQDACSIHHGAMHVILGLDVSTVEQVVAELKQSLRVWIANINCPGQIVIAGLKEDVEKASLSLKERGAKRALPLEVAGAFHTGLMQQAQDLLAPLIQSAPFEESRVSLVMNAIGGFASNLSDIRSNLIRQVTASVQWEKGVRCMMEHGIEIYIEMGPGKTLAGMNKKIGVVHPTLSIEKVSDLESFSKHIEESILCNC